MSLIGERLSKKALLRNQPYQIIGGQLISIADNPRNYIDKGYNVNDIVYSIVNLILDKVRVAPWALYKIVDEGSLKQLQGIQRKSVVSPGDFRKAVELRHKAIEPVKVGNKITELLKYPNDYETFNDFVANGCGYKLLTGNKYVWGETVPGGANKGKPHRLWLMPSQEVIIIAQGGFPAKVIRYQLQSVIFGEKKTFERSEVLHEKDMNYDYNVMGSHLYGTARLKAALRLTNRNNSALDATTAKFQNGGLEAIIFPKNTGFDVKEGFAQMQAVKSVLVNEYTGADNYGKIATSGYEVGVEHLGLSPVELAIIESEKWDLRRFCNVFGVPSQLLNDPENKSYNNAKEGEVALTNRCALPLLTSFRDGLNRKFVEDWGMDRGFIIDFDMTVYSELQENVGDMMTWIDKLMQNGYPLNDALNLLGLEKVDNTLFDEPWVKPGMGEPVSQWGMNEVDTALVNDDENIDDENV